MFWISLFVFLPFIWPLKCLSFDAQFQITFIMAIKMSVLRCTVSDYLFIWPLKCLSFDAWFRITFFMAIEMSVLRCTVSGYLFNGHWNVCPSMHGFYLFGIFKLFLQYAINIKICKHFLISVWQRLTKSCHTLRWIFLQSLMKFDERNPKIF